MIVLEHKQWRKIHARLCAEYPRSVMLIRGRMREVLGFTVREHYKWILTDTKGYYQPQICLDFYNDAMETWFQLKYM